MKRILKLVGVALGLIIVVSTTVHIARNLVELPPGPTEFEIIAHDGVHQNYPSENLTDETCTASRIYPLTHRFIDNTIPSIGEAFKQGATMVEMDIHPTSDNHMQIGLRLKELREEKNFSQGDIEKRTGMLRAYVSRVENGHTVPSVETLEKWARALEMPLYQVMYDGDEPPKPRKLVHEQTDQRLWGSSKKEHGELSKLCRYLAKMSANQRKTLLGLVAKMARKAAK